MSTSIDRIKKLLRLGRDNAATPAEAAAAMAKAVQLAAREGIDLAQIPADEDGAGGMTHRTKASQCGVPHQLAAGLVKRHFHVDAIFEKGGRKPVVHFVGAPTNCELASYCYDYLVRAMRAGWRNRTTRRLRDRDSFLRAFAAAVDLLTPQVFPPQHGLALSQSHYIETQFGRVKTMKGLQGKLSAAAAREGWRAGRNAGIRNGIAGTSQQSLLG